MTAIPFTTSPAPAAPRAKTIFYVRSVVALAMITTWTVSALSGLSLWQAADGWRADLLPALLGLTKHAWTDIHVVASFLAIALTITHVTVMRRGVLSYARLVLTGRRKCSGTRDPTPKSHRLPSCRRRGGDGRAGAGGHRQRHRPVAGG